MTDFSQIHIDLSKFVCKIKLKKFFAERPIPPKTMPYAHVPLSNVSIKHIQDTQLLLSLEDYLDPDVTLTQI